MGLLIWKQETGNSQRWEGGDEEFSSWCRDTVIGPEREQSDLCGWRCHLLRFSTICVHPRIALKFLPSTWDLRSAQETLTIYFREALGFGFLNLMRLSLSPFFFLYPRTLHAAGTVSSHIFPLYIEAISMTVVYYKFRAAPKNIPYLFAFPISPHKSWCGRDHQSSDTDVVSTVLAKLLPRDSDRSFAARRYGFVLFTALFVAAVNKASYSTLVYERLQGNAHVDVFAFHGGLHIRCILVQAIRSCCFYRCVLSVICRMFHRSIVFKRHGLLVKSAIYSSEKNCKVFSSCSGLTWALSNENWWKEDQVVRGLKGSVVYLFSRKRSEMDSRLRLSDASTAPRQESRKLDIFQRALQPSISDTVSLHPQRRT